MTPPAEVVTVERSVASAERRNVYVDGEYVGMVLQSDRRWVRGWQVWTKDGRDLGDQPRRIDAVTALVSFVTSPLRGH